MTHSDPAFMFGLPLTPGVDLVLLCCRIIPNVAALKIKREKISKQDIAFMKKVKRKSVFL